MSVDLISTITSMNVNKGDTTKDSKCDIIRSMKVEEKMRKLLRRTLNPNTQEGNLLIRWAAVRTTSPLMVFWNRKAWIITRR